MYYYAWSSCIKFCVPAWEVSRWSSPDCKGDWCPLLSFITRPTHEAGPQNVIYPAASGCSPQFAQHRGKNFINGIKLSLQDLISESAHRAAHRILNTFDFRSQVTQFGNMTTKPHNYILQLKWYYAIIGGGPSVAPAYVRLGMQVIDQTVSKS